jgi:hypothetical protein
MSADGTPGREPSASRWARWRNRLLGWLKQPIDYPMSTRSLD